MIVTPSLSPYSLATHFFSSDRTISFPQTAVRNKMGLVKETPSYTLQAVYPGNSTLATFQNTEMDIEELALCQRHKEMVEVSMYANSGQYEKAEEAFDRYMALFS